MARKKTIELEAQAPPAGPLFGDSNTASFDPKVASLFSAPATPLQQKSRTTAALSITFSAKTRPALPVESPAESSGSENINGRAGSDSDESPAPSKKIPHREKSDLVAEALETPPEKKRKKRKREDENLEARYLQKLAREEARETEQRRLERAAKKSRTSLEDINSGAEDVSAGDGEDDAVNGNADEAVPQHESLAKANDDSEIQKASRTVFLSNVSTEAMISKSSKRALLTHMVSIFPSAPRGAESPPKIESIRFRSTAYSNTLSKKAAFTQKDLMDATTKSTNAYIVYTTSQAAREAARKLNGTVALGRHIHVDEVAHPAKVDHNRCVFVGNLAFVDDDSGISTGAEGEEKKKKKAKSQPGDVEEGLWQQFAKAGTVENVRVVRDPKTRVGKGFAYVQFTDENAVEAALLFNDKKYPPLLPRKLRVVRARKVRRDGSMGPKSGPPPKGAKTSKSRGSGKDQTLRGRVKKLLGRAGAAQMNQTAPGAAGAGSGTIKGPDAFVFEGHRASSTQGNRGLKLGKSRKKKSGKPQTRSAKRGAAWKAKT